MKAEVLRFTLHSATIKTQIYENPENVFNIFTLHSATIKTRQKFNEYTDHFTFTLHSATIKTHIILYIF